MSVAEARPVVERIAVTLFERLQLMMAGTQTTKLTAVIRPKRLSSWTPKHLLCVLLQGEAIQDDGASRPGNPPAIAWRQVFHIRTFIQPSEKDPTPIDEYINALAADITRTITLDGDLEWFTFGNLAVNAEWEPPEMFEASGGMDGIDMPLAITYRTSWWDPYTVRMS